MSILIWVVMAAVLIAVAVKDVRAYRAESGTVMDKLAAGWRASLTIFVLGWGMILTIGMSALDALSSVTGDPQFAAFADSMKAIIPTQFHPYIPPTIMAIGIAARLTHNPPEK